MTQTINLSDLDDRGQLVLIGGITMAILLVVLVLILNGVLYTENIATREQPQAIDRTVDMGSVIDGTAEDLIKIENSKLHETEQAAAVNVSEDIEISGALLSERQFEAHGEILDVTATNVQEAWIIKQSEDSEFTPANQGLFSDVFGWEVATSDGIRDGTMTVTDARTFDDEDDENEAGNIFQLQVTGDDGSGDTWTLWVFEHPSQNTIALGTRVDGDGNPIPECTSDGGTGEVDLVDMTIDGNECPFDFAENVDSGLYELQFENADEIEGTYRFVLGKGNGAALGSELGTTYVLDTTSGQESADDEPTAYDGVYSATTVLEVDGEDVTSETVTYTTFRQPDATPSSEEP